MPSTGQPLFMFQLSPSPHLVTHNFTYYSPRIKHRSSQCQDGVWPVLVSQPILKLEKILSPQSSTPVPKFQHFSIFMHFYTLLIRCKKKKWTSCQFSYTDCKNQTGAENTSWSQQYKFLVPVLVWSICLLRLEIKLYSFQTVLKHIQYNISDTFKCKSLSTLYMNV